MEDSTEFEELKHAFTTSKIEGKYRINQYLCLVLGAVMNEESQNLKMQSKEWNKRKLYLVDESHKESYQVNSLGRLNVLYTMIMNSIAIDKGFEFVNGCSYCREVNN